MIQRKLQLLLLLFALGLSLYVVGACAPKQQKTTQHMDTLDITAFKQRQAQKIDTWVDDAANTIEEFELTAGYVQKVRPKNSWFYTYSLYYKTGKLKERGNQFVHGNYMQGIWATYNEAGQQQSSINQDDGYALGLKRSEERRVGKEC